MNAFVTGCTGYVGRHLVKRLLKEKYQVRALVRKSSDTIKLEAQGIEVHLGDITKPDTLVGIAEEIDVVFHLAGVFLGSDYKQVVVDGTKNIIDAFKDSQIESFVFTSFNLVYGNTKETFLNEEACCNPSFEEARYKLQAEEMLLKACHQHGFPAVVLRMPSIYGGEQSHFENIFIDRIKAGQMVIFGRGENKNSYVHIDDVVQALTLAATNENAVGQVFNISSGDVVTMNELCELIMKNVGVETPKHMPVWAAYIISIMSGIIAHLRGEKPPLPISLIKILTLNGGLDISKAKKILGYTPVYPDTLEGIRQSYFAEDSLTHRG